MAVVVAHRLVGMTRQLTPDVPRVVIAFGKVALLLFVSNRGMQLVAIALGGGLGLLLWRCMPFASVRVAGAERTSASTIPPACRGQRISRQIASK